MSEVTLFGIATCDSCKKAEKALKAAGYAVVWRDVRAEPLSEAEWAPLIAEFGSRLVNRNSTTWRSLGIWLREAETEAQLLAQPVLMQRPVLRDGTRLTLGWDDKAQSVWAV